MAKQSFVSPANSILLQVLKMIWNRTKIRERFQLCSDVIIYSKDTEHSIEHKHADMTRSAGAILSSSLSTQCWMSFFQLHSVWCIVFRSYLFFAEMRSPLFTTPLVLTRPRHNARGRALHFTRYNDLCRVHSHLSTWRLPIYYKIGAQSFGVRCWISHPVFSVFCHYCQRLKYILLL